jgi:hypothetical protein
MSMCSICKRHAGGWRNKETPHTTAIEAGCATGGCHHPGEAGAALGGCPPSVQRARAVLEHGMQANNGETPGSACCRRGGALPGTSRCREWRGTAGIRENWDGGALQIIGASIPFPVMFVHFFSKSYALPGRRPTTPYPFLYTGQVGPMGLYDGSTQVFFRFHLQF